MNRVFLALVALMLLAVPAGFAQSEAAVDQRPTEDCRDTPGVDPGTDTYIGGEYNRCDPTVAPTRASISAPDATASETNGSVAANTARNHRRKQRRHAPVELLGLGALTAGTGSREAQL